MKKLRKAIRLEINNLKENKMTFALLTVLPLVFLIFFAMSMAVQNTAMEKGVRLYDFYGPMVFAALSFFVGMQASILRIVAERKPFGTLDREVLALGRLECFIARIVAASIYVIETTIIAGLVALFVFPLRVTGSAGIIPLEIFLSGLTGVAIGMILSTFIKSKYLASQIGPLIVLLSLVLSDVILPEMPSEAASLLSLMPLNLAIKGIALTVFSEGYGLGKALNLVILQLAWLTGLTGLGIIKFGMENVKEVKRNLKKYLIVIGVFGIILGSAVVVNSNTWENANIDNFRIYEIKTFVGNYPHLKILNKFSETPIGIFAKDVEYYEWLLKDEKAAAALAIEFREKTPFSERELDPVLIVSLPVLSEILENNDIKISEEKIKVINKNGERVYAYFDEVVVDEEKYEVAAYVFGEDRFVFGVVGLKRLVDKIANNVIEKYPARK